MINKFSTALPLLLSLLLAACGGGGGGGGGGGVSPETQTPDPGVYTLRTAGGAGGSNGGTGGDGGAVTAVKEGGSGAVAVRRGGKVDAVFTPLAGAADLGAVPLVVTGDTTIVVSGSEPAAGVPYLTALNVLKSNLFISDGDGSLGDETPVTGISVAVGATLTFELNDLTGARLFLTGDIENNGAMTVVPVSETQQGSLEFNCRSYFGEGGVTTAGNGAGQSGGSFFIYATGSIVNRGPITTAGADNPAGDGGHGGAVEWYADGRIENTGVIRTFGGSATGGQGNGGAGGYVDLVGDYGLNNAGELASSGGDGYTSGGSGGWVWLEVYTEGELRNAGKVVSAGGAAAAGDGGAGGDLEFYAYGGSLLNAGDLATGGGKATGAGGNGGAGGYVILGVFQGYNLPTPPGDLLVSGNFDTSGGSAAASGTGSGGFGGSVDFYLGNYAVDNPDLETAQRLALLGYRNFDASGGAGNSGGSGGLVELVSDAGYVNPAGLTNEVDLVTRGGSAAGDGTVAPAWGGKGGDVLLTAYADPANAANPSGCTVVNFGAIDAAGGANREFNGSLWWAGAGGDVQMLGTEGVTNSGAITASGGADSGNDGWGGLGGWIDLTSGRGVTNTARLNAGGGDGEYQGGDAGEVHLVGQTAIDSRGDLLAAGGNADPLRYGSQGGSGGLVQVELAGAGSFSHSATVTVSGGSGSAPGSEGIILLLD